LLLRSNVRLVLGGLAAVALGVLGGWALLAVSPLAASAPTVAAPSPTPPARAQNAPPPKDAAGKPHLHLDGERSTFSYDGEEGSLHINKDRLSLRTPFGTFAIDW